MKNTEATSDGGKTSQDVVEPAYFASECNSDSRSDAIAVGLLRDDEPYYQLQRNDELDVFPSDVEAIAAALIDAARGNAFAIHELALAKTDLLLVDVAATCVL